jgi:hypothetical protein
VSPIILISIISIIIGSSILWIIPVQVIPLFMPLKLKLIPLIMVIIGLIFGLVFTLKHSTKPAISFKLHLTNYASCIIWFLVRLSTQPIIKPSIKTGHYLLKLSDQTWLEQLGAQGIFSRVIYRGLLTQKISSYSPTRLILSSVIGGSYLLFLTWTMSC